jgi:hypothetical protein
MSNVFPIRDILDWREDARKKAEVNRIDAQLRTHEQEIAKLSHKMWLLRMERRAVTEGGSHG